MLSNARKLGVFRKVLKHQVASQSFHASLQLTTAVTLADILQKLKVTISTLTPANEIHMEIIFRAWKCRCNNLDVDNNKPTLVDCNNGSAIIVATYQFRTFSVPLRHFWSIFSSASSSFLSFRTTLTILRPLADRRHMPLTCLPRH